MHDLNQVADESQSNSGMPRESWPGGYETT